MMEFHPLANAFPLIEGTAFDDLVESIKASGLREPIVTHEGMILDGRNRARACEAVGIDPTFQPFPAGADPVAFVIDKNMHRRHLTEAQRAMAGAQIATLKQGGRSNGPIGLFAQTEAAERLNISCRSIKRARVIVDNGVDELKQAVMNRKASIEAASLVATLSPEEQREAVASQRITQVAKKVKEGKKKKSRKGRSKAAPVAVWERYDTRDPDELEFSRLQDIWDLTRAPAKRMFFEWLNIDPAVLPELSDAA